MRVKQPMSINFLTEQLVVKSTHRISSITHSQLRYSHTWIKDSSEIARSCAKQRGRCIRPSDAVQANLSFMYGRYLYKLYEDIGWYQELSLLSGFLLCLVKKELLRTAKRKRPSILRQPQQHAATSSSSATTFSTNSIFYHWRENSIFTSHSTIEARVHQAGHALHRVEHVSVINPRPACIFAVSIPDEAYLCQYRQRSRSISSWLSKRTWRLLDWSCTCCAFNVGSTLW